MPAPYPDLDLLTPADAARILGLSVDMVRILAANGQLPTAAKTARGARLFRRDDVEELAAARAGRIVRHHSVQLYESDDHLARVVARFLADGLRGGAPAIVIANEAHRRAFVEQLRLQDVALDEAIASGQILLLDARETMARIIVDGEPDAARFAEHIGGAIERMRSEWPRRTLRAFGEMVDLLWKDGDREAAVALEELWNGLAEQQPFKLLCGYAMSNFKAGSDAPMFDRICAAHTRVIPAESFPQDLDIDRRHLEIARLQQRALALETELQTKDEILAMLGHELRNPLAPIMTAIDLLRMQGRDSREHAVIARQVRHLHRLVEDLLDVGRLTRGRVRLEPRRVSLAEVLARAIDVSQEALHARLEDLELDVAPELLATVDFERMAQALSNLLRNAAQNSEPGSKISVTAERSESSAVITVMDRGVGIAPGLLPHIFDLFVQERQAIDRSRGGLGIGLAITNNIVRLHGGSVTAESKGMGMGSKFVVRFPLLDEEAGAADRSSGEASGATGRRVLVVDDNEDAAELLAELLGEYGHRVEVAHHAHAALEAARGFDPELALLDIGLDGMDGYELAVRLRAEFGALRMIAVSGYGDNTSTKRSAAAGFEAHLVKPVRIEDLLRLMEAPSR